MGKFHFTAGSRKRQRVRRIRRLRFLLQYFEDTFRACHSRLKVIVNICNVNKGPGKLPGIQQEAGNQSHADPAVSRQDTADDRHNDEIQVVDYIGEWHEETGPDLCLCSHLAEPGVAFLKLLCHFGFPAKGLYHVQSGNTFLHLSVELSQNLLLLGKQLPRMLCNRAGQQKDKPYGYKGNTGQWQAEPQHNAQYAYNRKTICHQLRKRIRNGGTDIVHIIGQTAHQLTMLPAVKEGKRKCFHFFKQRAADMKNDSLSDGRHKKLL